MSYEDCRRCEGSGRSILDNGICYLCEGRGGRCSICGVGLDPGEECWGCQQGLGEKKGVDYLDLVELCGACHNERRYCNTCGYAGYVCRVCKRGLWSSEARAAGGCPSCVKREEEREEQKTTGEPVGENKKRCALPKGEKEGEEATLSRTEEEKKVRRKCPSCRGEGEVKGKLCWRCNGCTVLCSHCGEGTPPGASTEEETCFLCTTCADIPQEGTLAERKKKVKPCPDCQGALDRYARCPRCEGSGWVCRECENGLFHWQVRAAGGKCFYCNGQEKKERREKSEKEESEGDPSGEDAVDRLAGGMQQEKETVSGEQSVKECRESATQPSRMKNNLAERERDPGHLTEEERTWGIWEVGVLWVLGSLLQNGVR